MRIEARRHAEQGQVVVELRQGVQLLGHLVEFGAVREQPAESRTAEHHQPPHLRPHQAHEAGELQAVAEALLGVQQQGLLLELGALEPRPVENGCRVAGVFLHLLELKAPLVGLKARRPVLEMKLGHRHVELEIGVDRVGLQGVFKHWRALR
ncbi:MAG: hypothetical protein M5U09_08600 [Gammaproteobacteria bacterium]|nr:hypothetical protein [Gammaproteobacteria bacterium]